VTTPVLAADTFSKRGSKSRPTQGIVTVRTRGSNQNRVEDRTV